MMKLFALPFVRKRTVLDARRLDQLDLVGELVKASRRSFFREASFFLVALFGLSMWFVAANRPLPVVFRPEDPAAASFIVPPPTDVSVREVDAKRFFFKTARLLHGWSSADVFEKLGEARLLMTARWRRHFLEEVNAEVEIPLEHGGAERVTVLESYIRAKIRNHVELDWQSLVCRRAEERWHCRGKMTVTTQPLFGEPVPDDTATKTFRAEASFAEVPPTTETIDGLLVAFWSVSEAS